MTVMALVITVYKYKLRPESPGGVFYVRSDSGLSACIVYFADVLALVRTEILLESYQ